MLNIHTLSLTQTLTGTKKDFRKENINHQWKSGAKFKVSSWIWDSRGWFYLKQTGTIHADIMWMLFATFSFPKGIRKLFNVRFWGSLKPVKHQRLECVLDRLCAGIGGKCWTLWLCHRLASPASVWAFSWGWHNTSIVLTLTRMCTRPHIHNYMLYKVPIVVMETPYPELLGRCCVPKKCHGNFFFFFFVWKAVAQKPLRLIKWNQ